MLQAITVTCIQGSKPLVKHIGKVTQAYPMVRNVTSHEYVINSCHDFYNVILKAASNGYALMKGNFSRSLVNESRADLTMKDAPTQWLCLDFDDVPNMQVPAALAALGLSDVDYVLQYSASSGFKKGLCAHVFMLLDRAMTPAELKRWLQWKNMVVPDFEQHLRLNKAGLALRWTLDVCVADNSRILYIAPPTFDLGMHDPHLNNRITYVKGTAAAAKLLPPPNYMQIRQLTDLALTKLQPQGIKKRVTTRWAEAENIEDSYAIPSHYATVTDSRESSNGLTYINLNGGDSWGYYHSTENPDKLYNFKGEPVYRLIDIVPAYAKKMQLKRGIYMEAFSNPATERFYFVYGREVHVYESYQSMARVARVNNFQVTSPDALPVYDIAYDPNRDFGEFTVLDKPTKMFNTFHLPEHTVPVRGAWDKIEFVMRHICVDDENYQHFLNWCAFILQKRQRACTSWIFSGVQGTGKGAFFNYVMRYLLGDHNAKITTHDALDSSFNPYAENTLLLLYDEARHTDSSRSSIAEKLKTLITEPLIYLNKKFGAERAVPNFCNLLIFSNAIGITRLDSHDRRYNIAPRQEVAIRNVYPWNLQHIATDLNSQALAFYDHCLSMTVDTAKAQTVLHTTARLNAISHNMPDANVVAVSLKSGDLDYFQDFVSPPSVTDPNMLAQQAYNRLFENAKPGSESHFTSADLHVIFDMLCARVPKAKAQFGRYLTFYDIEIKRSRYGRTYDVTWRTPPT